MRIDEKSILTHILEKVLIVHTQSFLPGASVYVCIVQEEHNFFFFHNDLSFSKCNSHMNVGTQFIAFDSNVFIQEPHKDWPEYGRKGERPLVILSVSEESRYPSREILRCAQDDKRVVDSSLLG